MTTENEKISTEEFDEWVAGSNLREQSLSMARAVLVDGRGLSEVAEEFGTYRQAVYQAVVYARAAKDRPKPEVYTYQGSPDSFVAVDAIVAAHKGKRLLTTEQFEQALTRSRLAEHNADMARSVLCDGTSNIEVATTYGVARHLPWQAATRLLKHFDFALQDIRVYMGSAEMFAEIDALGKAQTKKARK